jgi:hypothetical protein
VLPDDVLLAIFDFYVTYDRSTKTRKRRIEAWQTLVHVCRRWRCLVFESPRRLNLLLVCTPGTPARKTLDVWPPALPLFIQSGISATSVDNIVFALGLRDRVDRIELRGITLCLQWDKVLEAMQVPFPALTELLLQCKDDRGLVIPGTFLGGSVPRLQYLDMDYMPFPGILNLLLSATHLINLSLSNISHSGYISPEAMATCLAVLTSLDTLSLKFLLLPRSHRCPPVITRSTLPNLTKFSFEGATEYLDNLVARIDVPRLDSLFITFPYQRNIGTPHLVQFISRTPRFSEPNDAHVMLTLDTEVLLLRASDGLEILHVEISCGQLDPRVSSIAQVCTMCLTHPPTVENLRLGAFNKILYPVLEWKDDINNNQWLDLLRPFTAVKSLYLSEDLQPDLSSALQELVGDRTMEVLPSLQNIFLGMFELSEPFQEAIGQFLAARQLSGHPITVLPLQVDGVFRALSINHPLLFDLGL